MKEGGFGKYLEDLTDGETFLDDIAAENVSCKKENYVRKKKIPTMIW